MDVRSNPTNSAMPPITNLFICYTLYLIGGVLLIAGAFTKKVSIAPYRIRIGLIFSGSITFLMGATGYTLFFYGRLLPKLIYRNLAITHYMLMGAGLSILVYLFISGAFKELSQKRKTDELPPTR